MKKYTKNSVKLRVALHETPWFFLKFTMTEKF